MHEGVDVRCKIRGAAAVWPGPTLEGRVSQRLRYDSLAPRAVALSPPAPLGLATDGSAKAKEQEKAAPGASLQFEWEPLTAAQLKAATAAAAKAVDDALKSLSYELEIADVGADATWRNGYRGTKAQCMIAIGLEPDKA